MRLFRRLGLASALAVLVLCAASLAPALLTPAFAQSQDVQALEPLRQTINRIEGAVRRGGVPVDTLADYSGRLGPLRDNLRGRIADLEPRLAQADERLKQLGPPPAAGAAPEDATIASERFRLTGAHAEIDAALKQARLLLARADQLSSSIAAQRRTAYTQELLEQSSSVLSPYFWAEAAEAVPDEISALVGLVGDWWASVSGAGGWLKLVTALIVGCVMAACLVVLMRWLRKRALNGRRGTRLTRALAGLGVFVRMALTKPLAVVVLLQTVESFGLRTPDSDKFTTALIIAVVIASVCRAVAVGVLAPDDPPRRLVQVDDDGAVRLARHLGWAGRWLGVMVFLLMSHKAVGAPHVLIAATNALIALGLAALVLHLLLVSSGTVLDADERPRNLWVRAIAWLIVAAIAVSLALGYPSLAAFLAERTLVAIVVCGALYLAFAVTDALFTEAFTSGTPRGRSVAAHLGIRYRQIGLIGTVLSAVSFICFVLIGIVLIVGPWQVAANDVFDGLRSVAFGIRIGEFNLSLGTILSGILLFIVILFITRLVQRWLETKLLPHTQLENSLQQSIATIAGYVGVIAAIILTLAHIGIDLQKIALIAGALSVGIGFGLQSIVSNFVSGLILLAERPIRVGDLINVKGDEGRVRRISVRATEVETGDRSSVIVPNSELITGVVKNRTRADTTTRTAIKIGVGYDSNAEQVRSLLLACAREHDQVLADPEPIVLLTHFGDSALEFELSFVSMDVGSSGTVASDIRFAILRCLGEAGVEIPYPQRELRWHGGAENAETEKKPAAPRRKR